MKKITKSETMCYVMSLIGIPMSQYEILKETHTFSHSKIPYKKYSNYCYFYKKPANYRNSKCSLIMNGFIIQQGNQSNYQKTPLYILTELGEKLAQSYSEKISSK